MKGVYVRVEDCDSRRYVKDVNRSEVVVIHASQLFCDDDAKFVSLAGIRLGYLIRAPGQPRNSGTVPGFC